MNINRHDSRLLCFLYMKSFVHLVLILLMPYDKLDCTDLTNWDVVPTSTRLQLALVRVLFCYLYNRNYIWLHDLFFLRPIICIRKVKDLTIFYLVLTTTCKMSKVAPKWYCKFVFSCCSFLFHVSVVYVTNRIMITIYNVLVNSINKTKQKKT